MASAPPRRRGCACGAASFGLGWGGTNGSLLLRNGGPWDCGYWCVYVCLSVPQCTSEGAARSVRLVAAHGPSPCAANRPPPWPRADRHARATGRGARRPRRPRGRRVVLSCCLTSERSKPRKARGACVGPRAETAKGRGPEKKRGTFRRKSEAQGMSKALGRARRPTRRILRAQG
ncbi:MAG: hypothetical protein J3K34DRAFT_176528 [Monoraphidium minutum]|nr:MAG: hypothetical protein J3K34DRAFT_176528 [Monoraphidium minutum]